MEANAPTMTTHSNMLGNTTPASWLLCNLRWDSYFLHSSRLAHRD